MKPNFEICKHCRYFEKRKGQQYDTLCCCGLPDPTAARQKIRVAIYEAERMQAEIEQWSIR